MTVLITGTAGFIGMHTALAVLQEGHDVIGIDCMVPYYQLSLKEDRLAELRRHKGYTHHHLDLSDAVAVEKLFAQLPAIDCIIHLAAQAGVRYARENPFSYINSNVMATTVLLENVRKMAKPVRFVYASSSSVYGRNTKLPFAEDDRTDEPASLYAATKKACEEIVDCYTHQFGLDCIGLRFFTVYGPWGRPDMAVWGFTEKMYKGEEIVLFDGGKLKRDFTYIDDIVAGVTACTKLPATGPQHRIYNLGNNGPVVVNDFVNMLAELTGKNPIARSVPAREDEVAATYADITRAANDLGFAPRTNLRTGLEHWIGWYKNYAGV